MNQHPAIAYVVAQQMLEERRNEARRHQLAKSARSERSLRVGRYRLTVTKEARRVPRTV